MQVYYSFLIVEIFQ